MIITQDNLDINIELLSSINKELGYNVIKPNLLGAEFSSSPYIDDVKLDLSTIVYNIMHNHCFSDGNKRTALCYMLCKSEELNLHIKVGDSDLYPLMIGLLNETISPEEFSKIVWK